MKNLYIILLLSISVQLNAQFNADVDGNYNVSPINGNLRYSYPLSNISQDGYPVNIQLKYFGNIKQTAFNSWSIKIQWTIITNDGYTFGIEYFFENIKHGHLFNTVSPSLKQT